MIEVVHKSEQGRDLLPGEHLVDKGYTDAHVLVESQREYGVTIIGPVAEDPELAGPRRRGLRRLFRARCTKAQKEPRIIGLQAREHHEALQAARQRQETEEFRQQYAVRAGIEGTHEQAIRRCGLRRCRYIGQSKAHLQHVLTAAAINVIRLDDWWAGEPVSRTRCSRFAALEQAA